jgi:protein-L-isoaspartate(D-aspartate) O-methyltransferase
MRADTDYVLQRLAMVDEQLRPRGIHDERVLTAFMRVRRELFVPSSLRHDAYGDHPVAIGDGQTVSQPYMVALMISELRLRGGERVLEVGTGSGYQTALLAELGCEVFTIERLPDLAHQSRRRLEALGYRAGIHYHLGDGSLGWPEHAPYERITVGAASPRAPEALVRQLTDDGILLLPVGDPVYQTLTAIEKHGARTFERSLGGCAFVPLIGAEGWPANGRNHEHIK